jgi:hypothetical protein
LITQTEKQEAIGAIAQANDGVVTPYAVVEAAKNPKHILHECFDWDDTSAAYKYRLDTARHLIASIEVLVEYEDRTVTAISYVHDVRQGRREQGYVGINSLIKRREDAQQTLLVEIERITASVSRARSIALGLALETYFEAILTNALTAKMKIKAKQVKKVA